MSSQRFNSMRRFLGVFVGRGEREVRIVMDSEKLGAVMEDKCVVGGGVQDAYGEDSATEDQPVTPWTVSVAR
ncbi:NADP-malic enzyme 4 [Actinidia rufa]|uniref:NADP-malic enzyme 4 n=1 Tax=Actinidia rufa TaxID=165716 RepID=A0A7J0GCP9_9ERIC|nr:NADP-malic enzyme 4 [Actinidia rufa]